MDRCCYFFSLRTGCLIIGYFNFILGVLAFILGVIKCIDTNYVHYDKHANHELLLALSLLLITLVAFHTICSVMLLYGVYKNKPTYLIPWMLIFMLNLLFEFVSSLYALGDFLLHPYKNMAILMLGFARLVFSLYCFACVFIYYNQLKQGLTNEGAN